jgi:hypothetical protein
MKTFSRLWHGELALQNAFWNWAVLGGLVVNVVTSALFLLLVMADRPVLALLVGYGLSLPYNIIVATGVWRSAERFSGQRRWAELAKLAVVIGMILLSVT